MTETEIQQLRQERERLAAENIVLKGQLQAVDAEIDGLRERHDQLITKAAAPSRNVPVAMQPGIGHGGSTRADLQRQIDQCREQLAARETTIEYLLESRSWKLTAPLRALDRRLRGTSAESTGRGLALANFPTGRGLRLISDVAGCWGDLWVATDLQFRFATTRAISGIVLSGTVPGDLASQQLRATVDDRTWTLQCGPGPFEWTMPVDVKAGGSAVVRISAERSWRPGASGDSADGRNLAWRIRGLAGQ